MTLVRQYAGKPAEQWRPLFFRILQNRIRDFHRRSATRSKLFSVFSAFTGRGDEPVDPASVTPGRASDEPETRTQLDDSRSEMLRAIAALPLRQQQAFTLRSVEGLDVAETARAMGCSAGSVKTHYSRAVHRLRDLLEAHDP